MRHEGSDSDELTEKTPGLGKVSSEPVTQAGAGRALLAVVGADGSQQLFPIYRNPTIIGRASNADVVLVDPAVSGFHARIIRHNFGYTVEDMGSAGGTFRHDKRINHARLAHGDVIRLGRTTMIFADEGAAASAKAGATTTLAPTNGRTQAIAIRPPERPMVPVPLPSFRRAAVPLAGSLGRQPPPLDGEDRAPSLDELILKVLHAGRYFRRRRWLIIGFVLGGGALGAASYLYLPPGRAAHCEVTLRPAPRANPIETETRGTPDATQFFEGAERRFLNRESIMGTLAKMGMTGGGAFWADAIAKRMRFENIGKNTYAAVLTPSLFDKRTDWQVRFLDAHLWNYIHSEIERGIKGYAAEVDFLRAQTNAAEQRLRDITQQAVKFREAHADQILAQSTITPGSQAELESKRIELTGRIDRLSGELEAARSQLARGSALSQAKSQASQSDREALRAVNRKLADLRAQGLADGHPEVQHLINEQRDLQRMLEEHLHSDLTQFEKNANVAYDSLRSQADQLGAQLRAARAERATIESGLRSLRAVSSRSPEVNARLEELDRMKEEAGRQQALLFDRLKKAEVQLELERVSMTSRYEIVVPASLEPLPGRKAFALRTALGIFLGMLPLVAVMGWAELRSRIARITRSPTTTRVLNWARSAAATPVASRSSEGQTDRRAAPRRR